MFKTIADGYMKTALEILRQIKKEKQDGKQKMV